ncbi:hypothetical protein CYMTET_27850 [Cymbomonas tetramitiformis]|uniref:Uncharacterized protein n=1 Tax=Cymbomonas tetramitiformis TaxID=36881 RepID=A0AAE0FPK6_9CHLO|nr:hypothetical protein CYMTET_27850 [Cymbomonas tetramitiformis]
MLTTERAIGVCKHSNIVFEYYTLEKQLVGNQEAFEQEPQGVHVNQQEAIQFQEDSETLLALLEESRQVLQDALLVWAPGLRSETADMWVLEKRLMRGTSTTPSIR